MPKKSDQDFPQISCDNFSCNQDFKSRVSLKSEAKNFFFAQKGPPSKNWQKIENPYFGGRNIKISENIKSDEIF